MSSKIEDLERLANLLDDGRVTFEEYELLKREVIEAAEGTARGKKGQPQGASIPVVSPEAERSQRVSVLVGGQPALETKRRAATLALMVSATFWVTQLFVAIIFYVDNTITALDPLVGLLDTLFPLIFISTAIAFVIWSYHAHSNLPLFGRTDIRYKRHETIWWWIVPAANFVMPYKVVHETFKGSLAKLGEKDWKSQSLPDFAKWWPATFVGGIILMWVAGRMTGNAFFVVFGIAAGSLALSAYAAVSIVNAITSEQIARTQILAKPNFLEADDNGNSKPAREPDPSSSDLESEGR